MTIPNLPVRYETPDTYGISPNREVDVRDYTALAEGTAYMWARMLSHWGSHHFGATGWQTSNTESLVTTPDNPGPLVPDLATIRHTGTCQRVKETGVSSDKGVQFGTEAFAQNVRIEITYRNLSTGQGLAHETMDFGAPQWIQTQALQDLDATFDGSGGRGLLSATYRVRALDTDGTVWLVRSGELDEDEAGAIPTRPLFVP